MFMDQICSIDGNFLNTWQEIKHQPNNNFKGRTPSWFANLENKGTYPLTAVALTTPLQHATITRILYDTPTIKQQVAYHRSLNEWDPISNDGLYGKTIEKHNGPFAISLTYRHTISQILQQIHVLTFHPKTPSSSCALYRMSQTCSLLQRFTPSMRSILLYS
ncbi:unnamed protein product [Rhizophagus irregularis]|uniref:Uncharacterized protein n=1 Tax=Rhizophagus irregularis TaxID=588596 RepID=A0A2I1H1E5_9GLOM|nr:hypothetical protein RhiirA4_470518 [Rhizophagus irregularis]CAB4419986.1 unnamed protein product [Rhizophagus irregularis]CAB4420279.1 unnamed protein product [Rhizophagus irregularis]